MFTDESRFCIDVNDGCAMVWRLLGEWYADCCVREALRRGGGSVMVWCAISWRYRIPFVVIDRNLTTRCYIDEVLQPVVLPFYGNHDDVMPYNRITPDLNRQDWQQVFLNKIMCQCYLGPRSPLI